MLDNLFIYFNICKKKLKKEKQCNSKQNKLNWIELNLILK